MVQLQEKGQEFQVQEKGQGHLKEEPSGLESKGSRLGIYVASTEELEELFVRLERVELEEQLEEQSATKSILKLCRSSSPQEGGKRKSVKFYFAHEQTAV